MTRGARTTEIREIPSDLGECERLSEKITAVAAHFGFRTDEMVAIALAVDEALRNALWHGNRSDRTKKIRVEYSVDAESVRVSITDEGPGFDLGSVPEALLLRNAARGGGRGIFRMGHFMSGLRFVPPGNRVEMWRRRGHQKWPQVPHEDFRTTSGPTRLLLAEDDAEMRDLLEKSFRTAGYEVTACGDGWSLLRLLGSCVVLSRHDPTARVDLVVSDVRMPFLDGLQVLEFAQGIEGFPPVILITAFGSEEVHANARKYGAAAVLDKPFDVDDLLATARDLAPVPAVHAPDVRRRD